MLKIAWCKHYNYNVIHNVMCEQEMENNKSTWGLALTDDLFEVQLGSMVYLTCILHMHR